MDNFNRNQNRRDDNYHCCSLLWPPPNSILFTRQNGGKVKLRGKCRSSIKLSGTNDAGRKDRCPPAGFKLNYRLAIKRRRPCPRELDSLRTGGKLEPCYNAIGSCLATYARLFVDCVSILEIVFRRVDLTGRKWWRIGERVSGRLVDRLIAFHGSF